MANNKHTHISTKLGMIILGFFLLAMVLVIPQLTQVQDTRSRASYAPTHTNTFCKSGVNSFNVNENCGSGNMRYASYTCYDGTTGKLGGPTSCKPISLWKHYANEACKGRTSCSMTPTTVKYYPTPTTVKYYPTPTTVKYYPTPTPAV